MRRAASRAPSTGTASRRRRPAARRIRQSRYAKRPIRGGEEREAREIPAASVAAAAASDPRERSDGKGLDAMQEGFFAWKSGALLE